MDYLFWISDEESLRIQLQFFKKSEFLGMNPSIIFAVVTCAMQNNTPGKSNKNHSQKWVNKELSCRWFALVISPLQTFGILKG